MAKKAPTIKSQEKKVKAAAAALEALEATDHIAQKSALPVPAVPSAVASFGNMEALAGFGLEDTTTDDYAIPFVRILQPMAPQITNGEVEGAESGDIIETATNTLYSEIDVIPCVYKRQYIEWKPNRGGFVATHEVGSAIVQSATRQGNKDFLPNGNELQNTAQFYCLLDHEGEWMPVVIPMSATQLKRARRWLTVMQSQKMNGSKGSFTPPMCAYSYTLKTLSETNNLGTWWSWDIGKGQEVASEELFNQALNFAKSVKGGEVKTQDESPAEDFTKPEAGFAPETDGKNIPF